MKNLITLFLVLISFVSFSEKIIVIDNDSVETYPVNEYVYIYKDTLKTLSIENLILKDHKRFFHLNNSSNINIGFTKDVYWVKFFVINKTNSLKNLVFALDYPLLKSVKFYAIKGSKLEKRIITGNEEPFLSRDIKDRTFLFDLNLEPNIEYTYIVRVSSEGTTLRLPMSISTYKSYIKDDNYSVIINGILVGLLLFSVLFNLFLLVVTRDIINFYYTVYVFLLAFFLINITGLTYQNLWPTQIWWQYHSSTIFAGLANIFLLLFTREFFNYKVNYPKINVANKLLMISMLLSLLLTLFDATFSIAMMLINILSLFTIFLVITVSISGLINKTKFSIYFLFSFTVLFVGTNLYVLRNLGVIDSNLLAEAGLKVGFLVEIIFLMFAVIHRYKHIEEMDNKKLEKVVHERTKTLIEQKEEIESQRDRIVTQHKEVTEQKELISIKNNEIKDSFEYAKLIQKAVLTPTKELDRILNNYFILNLPKETLGGDFYWSYEENNRLYVVVADCTGHGVPGAMMSMLGISALNEIVRKKDGIKPSEILNELSVNIKQSLHQDGGIGGSKDGMDIAVCMIDKLTKTMLYAGSNNPVYIYRKNAFIYDINDSFKEHNCMSNSLLEIKADKLTIGYNDKINVGFVDKRIDLQSNDMLYLFSDGFPDQFGGDNGGKYKFKRFRKLLADNSLIIEGTKQLDNIKSELDLWRGGREQIDDIIIFGIRI